MAASKSLITVSIVLYRNDPKHLKQVIQSLESCSLPLDIFFVDNSPTPVLAQFIPDRDNMSYQHNECNTGYGVGNNTIIAQELEKGDYHLTMNADVYFDENTLESIVEFMDQHADIGLLLPRVLNPDRTEQPLFKLLPRPSDLIFRRFIPAFLKVLVQNSLKQYRMSFARTEDTFDAPYLSGCFMFMRKKALREVGLFDPRFFLYCEDIDLSRRIRAQWRTVYYGKASIYHYFQKGSYKYLRLLYHHSVSAFKYFNKHGWFIDKERKRFNEETLSAFKLEERNRSKSDEIRPLIINS